MVASFLALVLDLTPHAQMIAGSFVLMVPL